MVRPELSTSLPQGECCGTSGQVQEITAASGKVPVLDGAVGGLSTATWMKQGPAFLLQILTSFWGWGDITRWSKGPAHARGMQSSKAAGAVLCGGKQVLMITICIYCVAARAVMLFALIPLPTIRSMLSKHVEGSSYGKCFSYPTNQKNCQMPPFGCKKERQVFTTICALHNNIWCHKKEGRSRETCRTSLSCPSFSSLVASSFIHRIFSTRFKRLLSVCSSEAGKITSEVLLKNTVLQGKQRACWAEAQWHSQFVFGFFQFWEWWIYFIFFFQLRSLNKSPNISRQSIPVRTWFNEQRMAFT